MGEAEEEVTPFSSKQQIAQIALLPPTGATRGARPRTPPLYRPSLPRSDWQPLGCMAALTATANAFSYFSTAMQSDGVSPPSTVMSSQEREREKKKLSSTHMELCLAVAHSPAFQLTGIAFFLFFFAQ